MTERATDCPICTPRLAIDAPAYAYLLGMYLGDGCISSGRKGVFRLAIVSDARYPGILQECLRSIWRMRPSGQKAGLRPREGCVEVSSYWKHWPCLFPQHGPGVKHKRKIELARWQVLIAAFHPEKLLRGLIHSDGYRGLNWVNGKGYPRYQFTNVSDDIRAIFCKACDDYGVGWRRMNWKTISIARAADVAKLDAVIGPKA